MRGGSPREKKNETTQDEIKDIKHIFFIAVSPVIPFINYSRTIIKNSISALSELCV